MDLATLEDLLLDTHFSFPTSEFNCTVVTEELLSEPTEVIAGIRMSVGIGIHFYEWCNIYTENTIIYIIWTNLPMKSLKPF